MGSRRDIVVLAAVMFVLAAVALIARPSADDAGDDPRASSFLTGPSGAAALFMLLDELGLPAQRQLHEWSADSTRDALVVLAPSQAVRPREMETLRMWIEEGGTLIYGAGGGDGMGRPLGLRLRRTLPDSLSALASVRWSGATVYPASHPLTAGIDSVTGFMRTFDASSDALLDPSAEVLMRTAGGAVAVALFRVGDGRVIAWSDASVLGNGALRDGDAALLFVRAAEEIAAAGGELRFDEYHHGYREARPLHALAEVLTGTGWGRAALQALAACAALLLFAGAPFGAPIREHYTRRRSPIEHMMALAGAYERAGARRPARRLLLAGMERRLGRRVLSADSAPPAALTGMDAGRRLKEEWERGEDGDLTDFAQALDDYVMEVRRWK